MMMTRNVLMVVVMLLVPALHGMATEQAPQSKLDPAKAAEMKKFPLITLYSVAWCPHCRAAKDYLTKHNIPFSNRDVELDSKAYDDLTIKYESTGVPVVVLGSGANEVVMKGFTPELFEESLKKAQLKK
jgi:glutaredoxin-like YruB-family protein